MTQQERDALYYAWVEADGQWHMELEREFKSRAGTVRYQPEGMGIPGTPLRAAYLKFAAARDAWTAQYRTEVTA